MLFKKDNMYKAAIVKIDGNVTSENFSTLPECDNYILDFINKNEMKHYRIINLENQEVLEDENGKRK